MKVLLLAALATSLTLGVDAFLDSKGGDVNAGTSGAGGRSGKVGRTKSGPTKSDKGGKGGNIGGNIDAKSGAGGAGGTITNNIGPYQQGPQVFYGSVSGPVGNTLGGGNANGAASGQVTANPNYSGASSKGGDSTAKGGKATGGRSGNGGNTGNSIGGSKAGDSKGAQLSYSPSLSIPAMRRRSLVSRAVQEALKELYAREAYPDPEAEAEEDDNIIYSRNAEPESEPEAYYEMEYAMYKRSAEPEPELFEADLSLYPRGAGYDSQELKMRGERDENGFFHVYVRDTSALDGDFSGYY